MKVLSSVGIEADDERLEKLLSELKGKDINTLIAEGSSKLASVPSGGGGGAVASSAPAAGGGGAAAAAEEKKEEKKEEPKEESDDDMVSIDLNVCSNWQPFLLMYSNRASVSSIKCLVLHFLFGPSCVDKLTPSLDVLMSCSLNQCNDVLHNPHPT